MTQANDKCARAFVTRSGEAIREVEAAGVFGSQAAMQRGYAHQPYRACLLAVKSRKSAAGEDDRPARNEEDAA
jgi:hypothetical protein